MILSSLNNKISYFKSSGNRLSSLPKVKDVVLRIMVLSYLTRQPLLRYLGPLSSVRHVPKRIRYAANAFLFPKHTHNDPKIFKKVKGHKRLEKGQPIAIQNTPRGSSGISYIKVSRLYFHHLFINTHTLQNKPSSTLNLDFRGLVSSLHHKKT